MNTKLAVAEGLESRVMLTAVVGLLPSNRIVVFDSASPEIIVARRTVQMPKGETLTSIDYDPSTLGLYGVSQSHHVYTIAPETGVVGLAADPPIPAAVGERLAVDVEIPSSTHTIRAIGGSGAQFEGTQRESSVGYVAGDVNAGRTPSIAGLGYAGGDAVTAYAVDAATDSLVTVGTVGGTRRTPNSGKLFTVGALGLDVRAGMSGFDVLTSVAGDATGYVTGPSRAGTVFCTVNLETGRARTVGVIGRAGAGVTDIAVFPTGDLTLFGLTTDNQLLVLDSLRPENPVARTAITGLRSDESMLGVDVRPGTGDLFGVSTRDQLYRVDPVTGAAKAVGARFTAFLRGSPGSMDFDPVSGGVTVVTDLGEVMGLDADTGAVVDARPGVRGVQIDVAAADAFFDGTAHVVTVAHSNNVAGAATSTLFGVNWMSRDLIDVGAGGDALGNLGLSLDDVVSLDIVTRGGVDVAMLAARSLNDRPVRVYQIDLATGAHTGGNGIAGGRRPVRDIAIVTD